MLSSGTISITSGFLISDSALESFKNWSSSGESSKTLEGFLSGSEAMSFPVSLSDAVNTFSKGIACFFWILT